MSALFRTTATNDQLKRGYANARSVAVATSTRAEWGLLRPFCVALEKLGLEVRVVATGTHLSHAFGDTWRAIEEDGFSIDERIPILVDSDDALGESKTMSLALAGTAAYLNRLRPDALLLLGDRYEMLAIAEAAFLLHIPIIHVHGGEVTEGAADDAIRHCITKLSSLHLTCTEEYRNRVIQLGEDPSTVYNVGAVGVENALSLSLLTRSQLLDDLGLEDIGPFVVMTYHPVTLGTGDSVVELDIVLDALTSSGYDIIATKANADAGGRSINARLDERAAQDARLHVFTSLGSLRYLSAVREAVAVVGNSSSGILEAPALATPVVNIGNRQRGRIRPQGVIDVALDEVAIRMALCTATSPEFITNMISAPNPYGNGRTSQKAATIIREALNRGFPAAKAFYDIVLN